MKIEEYACVEIKRRGQERILAETKDMTPEEGVIYYNRIGEGMRKHQAELRAKIKVNAS